MSIDFSNSKKVAIFGASGGIGQAFAKAFSKDDNIEKIYLFSRSKIQNTCTKTQCLTIDYKKEEIVLRASEMVHDELDLIVVATGLLHQESLMPEKSLRDFNPDNALDIFYINTIGPMLIAKYFIEKLPKNRKSVFCALSARVSSISDNNLGGWYSYRSAKAALNQMIKSLSIEMSRKNKQAICVGLHPGTVETALSKPFQKSVPKNKLLTPEESVNALINVINGLDISHTGRLYAWSGEEIEP